MNHLNRRTNHEGRRLRLRHWSPLVTVVVLAVWLAIEVHRANAQCDVVQRIQAVGGTVVYDWQEEGDKNESSSAGWFRRQFGADLFGHVAIVYLYNLDTPIDDVLSQLHRITSLRSLYLNATKLTDDSLAHVGQIRSLRELFLRDTAISSKGLPHLTNLINIEILDLAWTRVDDKGLRSLVRLANLKTLDLTRTRVTTRGVETLSKALRKCQIWNFKLGV